MPPPEPFDPRERLIVALDFPSRTSALELLQKLSGQIKWCKVGLELYLSEGRAFVEELRSAGYDVFLDLKLHDIPNTVAGAVRSAARSGASLLTLHAVGGPVMLRAAVDAVADDPYRPRLLAVTVLTSMNEIQLRAIGVDESPALHVERLASMALSNGVDGLVCSPMEVASLRNGSSANAMLVVPGIRGLTDNKGDQQRTATATDAIRVGADRLVVGRPITMAADPAAACAVLLEEIASARSNA